MQAVWPEEAEVGENLDGAAVVADPLTVSTWNGACGTAEAQACMPAARVSILDGRGRNDSAHAGPGCGRRQGWIRNARCTQTCARGSHRGKAVQPATERNPGTGEPYTLQVTEGCGRRVTRSRLCQPGDRGRLRKHGPQVCRFSVSAT